MKPTTKAPAPEPTAPDDEPGNTNIDGMSALHCGDEEAGVNLTGRGMARCRSALSGIKSITDILFQIDLNQECTGGIQANAMTTCGLIHALAVCTEFVSDHLQGGGDTPSSAQAVSCDSPIYAELKALHARAGRGASS